MPLNAKLVVVGGDVKTTEIKLRLPSTVGRGRGTTIMLPHPLVSRQHCELFENNGQLMVRDLGSLNGTFVNNQRVTESPLPPGELLTIGTVTFRAMYETHPDSQPPGGSGPQAKPRRAETDVAGLPPLPMPAAPPGNEAGEIAFEDAVVPVEEAAPAPASAAFHVTKRMETTLEDQPGTPKTESVASAKTKPAPPKGAATEPAPATAKPPAKAEVDFSKLADDEDVAPAADEDDDLGDFLKNLKK